MKKLDRELGLFSVFAISTGAMLGPGLFVLPGLAYRIGGPATILAYAFAGLLVIPAALSSESRANEIIEKVECSVARVRSNLSSPRSVLKRIEFDGEIPAEEITRREELVRRVGVESKEELFGVMAEDLATEGVSAEFIEEKLWDREGVDNTYIGNGVAFPHAIVDQLESTQGKVFLLEESIEYADDGNEVELVTALVGPTDERRYHLSIIGQFSQLLVDDDVKDLLMNSDDPEARLRRILRETSDE